MLGILACERCIYMDILKHAIDILGSQGYTIVKLESGEDNWDSTIKESLLIVKANIFRIKEEFKVFKEAILQENKGDVSWVKFMWEDSFVAWLNEKGIDCALLDVDDVFSIDVS
jgi:hypothetical protein